MELRIIIGGQAGQGVQAAAQWLSKAFVKAGYYVFNYRYYQSLIRGGHNYNSIRISDIPVYSHAEEDIDFIIALDQDTVRIHKNKLKEDGFIIADKRIIVDKKIEVDTMDILKKAGSDKISENVVLIAALWKILGLDKEILKNIIKTKKGDSNDKIIDLVYELNLPILESKKIEIKETKSKYHLTGSEAVAYGAIMAGLDIYLAYPMTPATPLLHILASLKDKYNILVYQPDNEIGVINMAIGASYAGAKVMVGTSGGGFALMNEALSLAGISEIPVVIYVAQRYTPATGMATHTLQGDLKFVLNAGHGEFPRIVVAPGDQKEAVRRTIEAFYLSYKYNVPAIILSDLFLAESSCTFDSIELQELPTDRFLELNPEEGYKLYKLTEEGYQKRAIPGTNAIVKANSYEHDEFGVTTEDPDIGKAMHEKRWRKMKYIEEEVKNFEPYKLYGNGSKLIVSWGSNKLPILEALKKLDNWSYLHVSYISPFPKDIKDIIENYNKVVLVENNVTGLFGQVLREQTGINIDIKILKYNGEPFNAEELIKKLSNI